MEELGGGENFELLFWKGANGVRNGNTFFRIFAKALSCRNHMALSVHLWKIN